MIFFADGSDDGTAAAKLVARILDPAAVCCVAVVVVTWPERNSPLWEKAHEVQFEVDDLHAAMAFAATETAKQLHLALATHADKIDELITTGDPAQATLKAIDDVKADLAFLTVSSGSHRERVTHWVQEVTRRAPCPVVVIHGIDARSRGIGPDLR
ncbi:MAG: universal stress protein [Vulcanimicrobiaceae bacterium]